MINRLGLAPFSWIIHCHRVKFDGYWWFVTELGRQSSVGVLQCEGSLYWGVSIGDWSGSRWIEEFWGFVLWAWGLRGCLGSRWFVLGLGSGSCGGRLLKGGLF